MEVSQVYDALKHWIQVVEADLEEGQELDLRYENAHTPLTVLRIMLWRNTLLILDGADSAGKGCSVILTTPAIQLEARRVKAEGPKKAAKIGFDTEGG